MGLRQRHADSRARAYPSLGIDTVRQATMLLVGYSFPAWLTGRTMGAARHGSSAPESSAMISPRRREGFDLNGERLAICSSRCDSSVINARCRSDALLGGIFERRAATPEFAGQLDIATPLRNTVLRAAPFRRQAVLARRLRCRRRRCVSHEAVYGGIRGLICRPAARGDLSNQIGSWAATLSWMTGELQ